jgi:hypothetical protein
LATVWRRIRVGQYYVHSTVDRLSWGNGVTAGLRVRFAVRRNRYPDVVADGPSPTIRSSIVEGPIEFPLLAGSATHGIGRPRSGERNRLVFG